MEDQDQDGDCRDIAGPSVSLDFTYKHSSDGKRTLIRANHHHFLHHTLKNGAEMWTCTSSKTCKAKLKILGRRILREDLHTCSPQQHYLRQEFVEECRQYAEFSRTPITKIYDAAKKKYVDSGFHLVREVPKFKSVKSSLYRSRNSVLDVTKTQFKDAREVEIPRIFEDFLLYDYKGETNRIIIFSSQYGRKIIQERDIFLFDGTFRSCPKPFYQIYTMHADVDSNEHQTNIISVLFALLQNKEQKTYEILFDTIKYLIPSWKPRKCILDFEVAALNAIQKCIPNVQVKGCNFHLKQAVKKKAKQLGVTTTEDHNHVNRCLALAHLPSCDVEDGWLALMEIAPDSEIITKFNNYFVDTWLTNNSIPIEVWNCEGERHRTISVVEAWHKSLNNDVKKNPRLLDCLYEIQEIAEYFEKYHVPEPNRTRQSVNNDIRIALILRKYKEKSISILEALDRLK